MTTEGAVLPTRSERDHQPAESRLSLLSLLPVACFLFVRDWPHEDQGVRGSELREIEHDRRLVRTEERLRFHDLFTSTPFWLITLCQVASATTIYTLIQWLPSYLTALAHLSFASMGTWITAGYLLATFVTLAVGYIGDRTMRRALTAAAVSLSFALLILPAARALPPGASAVVLASLISVPSATAALNGALMHMLVRPEAIARGTGVYVGIGNVASAAGPTIFGVLINAFGGQYWGGFVFLAVLNGLGAVCYMALHRLSTRA